MSNLSNLLEKHVLSDDNRLTILRNMRNVSISELAQKTGISPEKIECLEASTIELLTPELTKIAKGLNINVDLLLSPSVILSSRDIRLLDTIFYRHSKNMDLAELKRQILNWAVIIIANARKEWQENRNNSIKVLRRQDCKNEALKRAKGRDKRYAPFREYFKKIQKKKFLEYQKSGKKLKANLFVMWFLENNISEVEIPYVSSNQYNKLMQLAQENNREFKKAFDHKSGF